TGVQTCALPICRATPRRTGLHRADRLQRQMATVPQKSDGRRPRGRNRRHHRLPHRSARPARQGAGINRCQRRCRAAPPDGLNSLRLTPKDTHTMYIYRARDFHTPTNPLTGVQLSSNTHIAMVVDDGKIIARADIGTATTAHPDAEVIDLRDGILIPGLIDTHVHYPQIRTIGHLGNPLLEWLNPHALPEVDKRDADDYARNVAE